MTGTLYLATSLFAPALMKPAFAPDDYGHDTQALFVTFQPMLLRPAPGHEATAPAVDALSVDEYFSKWRDYDPAQGVPVLIDQQLAEAIDSGQLLAVPVPFPPNRCLELAIDLDAGTGPRPWSDRREFGGTTLAGQPVNAIDQLPVGAADGWPGFAALSNALPLVRKFADLDLPSPSGAHDPARHEAVRRWLIGLFVRMSQTAGSNPPPSWRSKAELEALWVAVERLAQNTPLSETASWDALLLPAGALPAGPIYDGLIVFFETIQYDPKEVDPILKDRPPRFAYRPHEVEGRADLFDDGGRLAGRSYLDHLWSQFEILTARGTSIDAIETMLGRLTGFGERLAWPVNRLDAPTPISQRYMVLQQLDADWFVTNAISLSGQVFRIAPLSLEAPLISARVTSLQFGPDGAHLNRIERFGGGDASALLSSSITLYHQGVVDAGLQTEITITPKWSAAYPTGAGSRNDRIVHWQEREASPEALAPAVVPVPTAAGEDWFILPPSLLDLADDVSRGPAHSDLSLRSVSPPRRALLPTDVVGGAPLDVKQLYLRLPAHLLPYPLGQANSFAAYSLALDALHESDGVAATWLYDLARGARAGAELWIKQKGGARPQSFVLRDSNSSTVFVRADLGPGVLVLDEQDVLSGILASTPEGPGSPQNLQGWAVDVVFSIALGEPFNLLLAPNNPGSIRLTGALSSWVGLSANRIAQSIAVSWDPGFSPDKVDRQENLRAVHAGDLRKLRLQVPSFLPGNADRSALPLADPDALLPLGRIDPTRPNDNRPSTIRGPVQPKGPQAWYWLPYHLDQTRDITDPIEEAYRFAAWMTPSVKRLATGYVEHQFGHRVPVKKLELQLPRSVEILHPVDVSVRGLLTMETAPKLLRQPGEAVQTPRRGLLRFSEHPTVDGRFRLTLHRKVIRLAIEKLRDPAQDSSGRDESAEGGRMGAIRKLYQAFGELRDAMQKRHAFLVIEGWRFDNQLVPPSSDAVDLGIAEPQVAPTILDNLRLADSNSFAVSYPPTHPALAVVMASLDRGFSDFVTALDAAVPADPIEDADEKLDSPWAELGSYDYSALYRVAHFARGQLLLERDGSMVPDADWGDAVFVPLKEPEKYAPGEETALAQQARSELRNFLKAPSSDPDEPVSRLWRRRLPVELLSPPTIKGVVLGDHLQTLTTPRGQVDPTERVLDCFFVPFAFLVPKAHPALLDRQATADFAQWLISFALALAEGREITGFANVVSTLREQVALRANARVMIGGLKEGKDLVAMLKSLLVRVEKDEPRTGSPAERALFDEVTELVRRTSRGPAGQTWPEVARSLLARRPTLFGEAKGIALLLFEPQPGDEQLFSLQLTKRIFRDGDPVNLDLDKRPSEVERFDFTRQHLPDPAFYVDVLPASTYDDLLVIGQNQYTGISEDDFDRLGEPRFRHEIAVDSHGSPLRGDALARSAEEVIDRRGSGDRNPIEANVVHYNPDWRKRSREGDGAKFFYVLPERRIPKRPRMVPKVFRQVPPNDPDRDQPVFRSEIAINDPDARPDLAKEWSDSAGAIVDSMKAIEVPTGDKADRAFFFRILPGGGLPAPHDLRPQPGDWQVLTTYLSHHWFSIDLEDAQGSIKQNFDDLVFDIEVEFWAGSPPPAPAASTPQATSEPLLDWYNYQRALARGEQPGKAPGPIAAADVVRLISNWLTQPPATAPYLDQSLLAPPDRSVAVTTGGVCAVRRRYRLRPPTQSGQSWFVDDLGGPGDPREADLGALAAFEFYGLERADKSAPTYDGTNGGDRVMLRLTILDHPFHSSRVRITTVKNSVDINGDSVDDIRPEFILSDGASAWTANVRSPIVIDPARLNALNIPSARGGSIHIVPQGNSTDWLRRWLGGDTALAPDVAAAFEVMLNVTYPDEASSQFRIWEREQMLSGRFEVSGMVGHHFVDTALARYAMDGRVDPLPDDSRNFMDARQIIPLQKADGVIDYLADALDPAIIGTLEPQFTLTWVDGDRIPVLSVTLPMWVRH